MRILSYLRAWPVRVALAVIGAVLVLSATFTIYNNLKKDSIDGRGTLSVAEECRHVGPWDYDFECTGEYTQGSGMISVNGAVVRVTGKYNKGDVVNDIYRDQSVSYDAPANRQHYLSGEDRRSLVHNVPYIIVIQIGFILMLCSLLAARRMNVRP